MARIDYSAIEDGIEAVLKADSNLSGVTILVEEEIAIQRGNIVGIYLDNRSAPPDYQSISAGTRTRMFVQFELWCWHFGPASEQRLVREQLYDLVGNVELALMGDRTLNGTVTTSWLEGGDFLSGPDQQNDQFMSGASIILVADATAVK